MPQYEFIGAFDYSILAISMSYDLTLPNAISKEQVTVNDYMDEICVKVEKAIDICDRLSLGKSGKSLIKRIKGMILFSEFYWR